MELMSSHQWPGRALECVQYLCVSVKLAQCSYLSLLFSSVVLVFLQLHLIFVIQQVLSWWSVDFSSHICSLSLSLRVESGGGVGAVYLQYQ